MKIMALDRLDYRLTACGKKEKMTIQDRSGQELCVVENG
jgi:hypothetical protein